MIFSSQRKRLFERPLCRQEENKWILNKRGGGCGIYETG
jgi:hypothetical protein